MGRQIFWLKTEVCIIEVNAGEEGGATNLVASNQNGEEIPKNSSFEVHNLTFFFGLPFCKPQNIIMLDRVLGRKTQSKVLCVRIRKSKLLRKSCIRATPQTSPKCTLERPKKCNISE